MRLLDVCLTTREEGLRMDVPTIGTPDEPTVLWIVPTAWEDELEVLPQHDPIPLRHWLAILREWGMDVVTLPYQNEIAGGPADGGRVVAVEADNGRHYFALPPAALPALRGLLSNADYDRLLADAEEED
jgi:hypothetical protein